MSEWQDEAKRLRFTEGLSWRETARALSNYFPGWTEQQVLEKVRRHLRYTDEYKQGVTPGQPEPESVQATVLKLLQRRTSLEAIGKAVGVSEKIARMIVDELREAGHCVEESGGELYISNVPHISGEIVRREWNGDRFVRFGLLGDTQINSKYTQITHLHKAYEIYEQEGIETVYHTGDMDEGEQMRQGHQYECYEQGADAHVDEIVRVYPQVDGIKTEFITGNHDHSLIIRAGYDIGRAIAGRRPDMEYLGQSQAYVKLTPNCTLELRHPGDGTAYAQSYKIQKMIEAMSGGEKPNLLAVGHYHKTEYLFYRNVHAIQTATLQAQTPWMRGKGIAAALGFWIVELTVDGEGHIQRLTPTYFPFYKAIPDDYRNWR